MSWDNKRGSRPDNAVYVGNDASGSGSLYVMRVQLNIGLVPGKYAPDAKSIWIPYGGYEYGGYANFEVNILEMTKKQIRRFFSDL